MRPFLSTLSICLFIISVSIPSCKVVEESQEAEGQKVAVKLNIDGEIQIETAPLKDGATVLSDESTLYGVIITTRISDRDSLQAYGLFNDPSRISMQLDENKSYKIHVTAIKAGSGYGLVSQGTMVKAPFSLPLNNSFTYRYNRDYPYPYFWRLAELYTNAQRTSSIMKEWGEVDRYMGTLEGFIPTRNNSIANVYLQHLAAGVEFKAPALKNGRLIISGSLTDTIYASGLATKTHLFELYSKAYMSGKYDSTYNTSTVSFGIRWIKSDGTERTVVSSQTLVLKRKTLTTVSITLPPEGGVSVVFEDEGALLPAPAVVTP